MGLVFSKKEQKGTMRTRSSEVRGDSKAKGEKKKTGVKAEFGNRKIRRYESKTREMHIDSVNSKRNGCNFSQKEQKERIRLRFSELSLI